MMVLEQSKDSLRATVLVMFVFSYIAAIAVQAAMVGLSDDGLTLTVTLAPATLIGVFFGKLSVEWISERAFRRIISVMLLATAAIANGGRLVEPRILVLRTARPRQLALVQ